LIKKPLLNFLVPVYRGLPSSLKWRVGRPLRQSLRKLAENLPETIGNTNRGVKLKLNPKEHIDSHILIEGCYEPDLEAALEKHLESGQTFLDVGANIGHFTLLAQTLVGADGQVISIEAAPEMRAKLEGNVALNNFPAKHSVLEYAVWSSEKELEFNIAGEARQGMNSLRQVSSPSKTIKVKAQRIDNIITEKVDVMKMDVEGAEQEALLGAGRLLS